VAVEWDSTDGSAGRAGPDSPTRIRPGRLLPTDDLDGSCRQNPDGPDHGRRGARNLAGCGHYGRARHRLLYCRTCKARSSEFKGTPLFNSKLPHEKVLAILQHLADGRGVRETARLVGVNRVERPRRDLARVVHSPGRSASVGHHPTDMRDQNRY